MNRIFKGLDRLEEAILSILMLIMTIAIVTQVFSRTIFNNSLAWTEEVARFILVWITFIGASLGVKKGAHIGVEAFTMLLPKKVSELIKYLVLIICMFFTFTVFKDSISILQKQISTGQVSSAVQIPMWIPYLGVTVGTFLMTLRFIEAFCELLKNRKIGGKN
ncbi:MAG: TRAP transporter small permease [Tissierellaceae bacterium]